MHPVDTSRLYARILSQINASSAGATRPLSTKEFSALTVHLHWQHLPVTHAERLAVAYGIRHEVLNFTASSAGTGAVIGHPIHPQAAPVLEDLGGDASNFAARQLNSKIASNADLILTMTRAHRDAVLEQAPHRLHRTFTLSEAARLVSEHGARSVAELPALRPHLSAKELLDIPDPIGQGPEIFAATGARIAELLRPYSNFARSLDGSGRRRGTATIKSERAGVESTSVEMTAARG